METELVIVFTSCIFIIVGVMLWQKGNYLLKNGKTDQAIIYRNNYHSDDSGGMYFPVVRFLTDKKEWITQELSIGYSPAKLEGTKLQVIYDPDDPTNVEINSPFQLKILPVMFVVPGIVGFIFGVLGYADIIAFLEK